MKLKLKRIEIAAWCDHLGTISLSANDHSDDPGIREKLVTLSKSEGMLSFQFSMKPDQARSMADALLACCEELERVPA
jgi:hypothetical protein